MKTNNYPDSAELKINREERLSDELMGIELGVKIVDAKGEPVQGWPFSVNSPTQLLVKGITNESGEYSGRKLVQVARDTNLRVFLVLTDSTATDWKWVPKKEEIGHDKIAEQDEYPEQYVVSGQYGDWGGYKNIPLGIVNATNEGDDLFLQRLLAYNPARFRMEHLVLMDGGVFDAELNIIVPDDGHHPILIALAQFILGEDIVNIGKMGNMVNMVNDRSFNKKKLDSIVDSWIAMLKSRALTDGNAKVKLICLCKDIESVKITLTAERIEKIRRLAKAK
ncbi:MAG: hypothetical protein WC897_04315 [Candidatus Gracilibacteria bacterium]